jgi:chemotaxis protein MotA
MATSLDRAVPPLARGPVVGAAFGTMIVLSPIIFSAHGFLLLFSLAGLVIVVGGVCATAFMSFPTNDVTKALRAITAMLRENRAADDGPEQDMNSILHWVRRTRSGGLVGLRASLDQDSVKNPFVNYGLNMVLSEYRPDDVRAMMRTAADASYDRDCVPVDVLRAMTSHAPAFGMIGTLIGMIAMLGDLNGNIAGTGSTLAVAFLSTLYGVASARMIYMPAASRLQQEVDRRQRRHDMITEGIVMLARGEAVSYVQDRLNGFLRPEQRDYFDVIAGDADTGFVTPGRALRAPAAPEVRGRQAGLLGVTGL